MSSRFMTGVLSRSVSVAMVTMTVVGADAHAGTTCAPVETEKLLADRGVGGDKFGFAADFDGTFAVIGAFGHSEAGSCAGSAYVFTLQDGGWSLEQEIIGAETELGDRFGMALAIDGGTIVVGSRGDADLGFNAGSVSIFVREDDEWVQQDKLLAFDGAEADLFGFVVAIDGDTVAVGAPNESSHIGAVYIYVRRAGKWSLQQKIVPDDGIALDEFGTSVALHGDTLVGGSIGDDDHGSNSGSAYVFTRSGSRWTQRTKLLADDGALSDNFGFSAALQNGICVIGTPGDDDMGPTSGSAYVFEGAGETWPQVQKLIASDGVNNAQLGSAVSIDGDIVVVGAWNDTTIFSATGSAYVYVREGGTWTERAKLLASDAAQSDNMGSSLRVIGQTVVAGASNNDDFGENSGSAYIWELGCAALCTEDLDGSEAVDFADLLRLIMAWGPCPPDGCDADVDASGDVGFSDLLILLTAWGPCEA